VSRDSIGNIEFLAFQNAGKPKRRRKTIADMTPEQIERARQMRLDWYQKNKDKVKDYTKEEI